MSTELQLAADWPSVIAEKLPDVSAALPPETINADQLRVAFMAAFNSNPALRKCSRMSVCAALINCASLGIVPNTPEQHAYLIPRGGECQLQIGYRGFCHMILRSGAVAFIDGDVIHDGDEYELQKGDPVICRFKPNLLTANRREKKVVGAYAMLTFQNGEKKLEVMDATDLAKIEQAMLRQNNGKSTPAWREWKSEMLRKAPLKRIAKTSNLGSVVARAAEFDNEQFKSARQAPKIKDHDELLALGEKLWGLLSSVRGDTKPPTWDLANAWMHEHNVLDKESGESAPNLSAEQWREAIARCEILKDEGTLK